MSSFYKDVTVPGLGAGLLQVMDLDVLVEAEAARGPVDEDGSRNEDVFEELTDDMDCGDRERAGWRGDEVPEPDLQSMTDAQVVCAVLTESGGRRFATALATGIMVEPEVAPNTDVTNLWRFLCRAGGASEARILKLGYVKCQAFVGHNYDGEAFVGTFADCLAKLRSMPRVVPPGDVISKLGSSFRRGAWSGYIRTRHDLVEVAWATFRRAWDRPSVVLCEDRIHVDAKASADVMRDLHDLVLAMEVLGS